MEIDKANIRAAKTDMPGGESVYNVFIPHLDGPAVTIVWSETTKLKELKRLYLARKKEIEDQIADDEAMTRKIREAL